MSMVVLMYLLKVNAVLASLALVYFLGFKKLNLPVFKRFLLIGGSLLACAAPFISFSTPVDGTLAPVVLPEVLIQSGKSGGSETTNWFQLVPYAYALVSLLFLGRAFLGILKIVAIRRRSEVQHLDGYRAYVNPSLSHTFSFADSIFTPDVPIASDVLEHERMHIELKHTSDKLWFEFLKALFWFNPAVYLLSKWSAENHEFEVDQKLLNRGLDELEYSRTLVSHALAGAGVQLSNCFSQVQILKTRINMMKTKTPQRAAWRAVLALPAVAVALVLVQACDKSATPASTNAMPETPAVSEVQQTVDQPAEYQGGTQEMMKYLGESVVYPESSKKNKKQGTVYVSFVINQDGKVMDPKVMRGVDADIDAEAIRVVSAMKDWKPATKLGQPVASQYTLPFKFALD